MRMRLILLSALLLSACFDDDGTATSSTSDAGIHLVTDGPYEAGETGELLLINRSGQTLEYNTCRWTLMRRHGPVWVEAPFEEERVCTLELEILPDGETDRPAFDFDGRLPWGRYRLQAGMRGAEDGENLRLVSREFLVVRPTDD